MTVNELLARLQTIASTHGNREIYVGPLDDADSLARASDAATDGEPISVTFDDVGFDADGDVVLTSINL